MTKLASNEWMMLEHLWELAEGSESFSMVHFLVQNSHCPTQVLAEFERLWEIESAAHTIGIVENVVAAGEHALDHDAFDLVGTRLGSYRLERVIGRGGASTVYLGRRSEGDVDHVAAVKVISTFFDDSSAGQARFARERQILAKLRHPFVTQFIDSGKTAQGLGFVIVEYIEGDPITDHVRLAKLTLRQAIELYGKTCVAVDYLHRHLVVHRDLKPSNVFVCRETGDPKILDFGVAKLFEEAGLDTESTQTVAFTPSYASPEQIAHSEFVGIASDIYSLGVILYQIVFGVRPLDATVISIPMRLEAQNNLTVPRITKVTGALDPSNMNLGQLRDLRRVIARALKPEPSERYTSVRDFSDDLLRLLQNKPIVAARPSLRYRFERLFARRRPLIVSTFVLVIALISSLVLYANQSLHVAAQAQRLEATTSLLTDILVAPDPLFEGKNVLMVDVIKAAADRLSRQEDIGGNVRAEVELVLGRTFLNLGNVERASALLTHSEALFAREFGEQNPRTLEARTWNVELSIEKGMYPEALEVSKRLATDVRLHPETSNLIKAMALRQLAMLKMTVSQDYEGGVLPRNHGRL